MAASAQAFHTSPLTVVLNCPHLVDSILGFANQSTLVTLLRVNKQFYDLAAPVLYHTVRLHDDIMEDFFHGALYSPRGRRKYWGDMLLEPLPDSRKGKLLALVRVLSLASHQDCWVYSSHVGQLLSGVDTIRAVPTPQTLIKLEPFCIESTSGEGCPFLRHIYHRRLVVRNVDFSHSVKSFVGSEGSRATEGAVWVLPTKDIRFPQQWIADYERDPYGCHNRGTIVFEKTWETWRPPTACSDYTESLPVDFHDPVPPADIAWGLFNVRSGHVQRPRTVYGLEAVELRNNKDDMVRAFQRSFPDVLLTQDQLRQMVMDETSTGSLHRSYHGDNYGEEDDSENEDSDDGDHSNTDDGDHSNTDNGDHSNNHVVVTRANFMTLAQYAALNPAERRYVLDDGTGAHFFEP